MSASLTEEEQVQCVLAGLSPAQFIAQRDRAPPQPVAPTAASNSGKLAATAAMDEDNELAYALLLSTQQYR